MQHTMPPETYGSEGRVMYAQSYEQELAPQTPRRQSSSSGAYATPSRPSGYREDYSRAQHASLQDKQSPGHPINRPSSEPGVSQDHLRFSAHINRFASHDPRMTRVHSNRAGVSVSERIKRFSTPEVHDADMRRQPQMPPSRHQYQQHPSQQYRTSPAHSTNQEQAPRTPSQPKTIPTRPESSYRRHQEMAQDHYHLSSSETRQYQSQQDQQTTPVRRSHSRGASMEPARQGSSKERRRSQSPVDPKSAAGGSRSSHSRDRIEKERRSQSPAPRPSPSRMSETQRAARSLLAKRRQRRLEQEEETPVRGNEEVRGQDTDKVYQAPAPPSGVKKSEGTREEGRTDRILREARSRSASPRTNRYSRKSLATRPPYANLLNGTPEKPVRVTEYHGAGTPERSTRTGSEHQQSSTPVTQGGRSRAKNYGSPIAMQQQEPVSPMTPGSPVTPAAARTPGSPASQQSPTPRNSRVKKNSGDTITSAETNTTASVQELKRQLWDSNEKLQVPVKPSLPSHGYSDKRTKQTSGYYTPEMAGNQGQRVRSLSPNSRQAAHGHEQPASSIEPPSSSAVFNSKFLQAAMASKREGHSSPQPVEDSRMEQASPHRNAEYQATTAHRHSHHHHHHHEDKVKHRPESPRPPVPPGTGEPHRTSREEELSSPRTGMSPVHSSAIHSIERVPSSAGVSTATGEVSVSKLVAKLSSVSRDDPELALQMIDSILRAESNSSGGPGSRAGIQSAIAVASQQKEADVSNDNTGDGDDDEDDESESSSFDDSSSVSSITNPTYQRDDKLHAQSMSTSNSRNPRPSSLNKYSQLHPTSPPEEERGNSRKAKKKEKSPPPATIKVNGSNGNSERSGSRKESRDQSKSSARKVRGLSPSNNEKRKSKPDSNGMDAAAIALKIQRWDEQINNSMEEPPIGMVTLDETPLSPTRTEDTAATEDLGSIITPQSQKQVATESRRPHPWDDMRPQDNRKARAIDLSIGTIGTYMNKGFGDDEEMANAFEPASPWQRRRAAKRETDGQKESANTERTAVGDVGRGEYEMERSRSRSSAPRTLSNSRIAPNVYDVHRKRRSRSGSRDRRPESTSPTLDKHTPSRRTPTPSRSKQSERSNPFDSDYENPPTSTKSATANPFDPSYTNPFSSSKSDVGATFDSAYKRRPSSAKSDVGNVFDSAWVALPADAFPNVPAESRDRTRGNISSTGFPDVSPANDLPPRTPTSRVPLGKEEAPEASRDPNDSGSKSRRSFLRMRRSSTPKKDGPAEQKEKSTKPLLSVYAMDSVTEVKDEFRVRRRSSKSPGRRSRTLSPAPRSVMKSRSPGRNRLKSRNGSFTDGEDETSSLTGSLTGSTASSVRNKNLAKKFSRFLKVYED